MCRPRRFVMSVSPTLNSLFPPGATVPRLALCNGCGKRNNTLRMIVARARVCVCAFSSMAARMQPHHRTAHCAHMVSTDKAVSAPLRLLGGFFLFIYFVCAHDAASNHQYLPFHPLLLNLTGRVWGGVRNSAGVI